MNKIKSIYMLFLPMILMFLFGLAIFQLIKTPFNLVWLALMVTVMPLLMFLMQTMLLKSMPRSHKLLPFHTAVAAMGLALAIILYVVPNLQPDITLTQLPLVLTELGFILHIAYVFWYSSLERPKQESLKVGNLLPSFTSYNKDVKVPSESFLGIPTIIIFYRGNWCPFCVAQIKELAQQYRQLVSRGIKIVLISPQPELITQKLAERFNVPFVFLTDKNNEAAGKLGLKHQDVLPKGMELMGYSSDTVFPTVLVTNKQGKIIYLDETPSFRDRPDPKEYLSIILNERST